MRSVAAALAAHCTDLDVPARPRLLALANVQHLATDVTGRLADGATVLGLAASLHPTAAVCGTPTERAAAVIRELEGMERIIVDLDQALCSPLDVACMQSHVDTALALLPAERLRPCDPLGE
mgnify:CR=1 FL=1